MVLLFVAWRFTDTKTAHACSQSSKIGLFGCAGANNVSRCTVTTEAWALFLSSQSRPRVPRVCAAGEVGWWFETVIAFVGGKWAFWVRFSVAEVIVVSMVAVQGRALVMAVSMVAVQGRAVVLSVSKSPRCRSSCAKKFALRAHNGSKLAFLRLLGELFAEMPLKGPCWAIFSRQSALRPGLVGDVAHEAGCGGGFAALEAG